MLLALLPALSATLAHAAATPSYTVSVGATGPWAYPDDAPAFSYIDRDGTYYFQEAHALYSAADSRKWSFYTGSNMDTAKLSQGLTNAVNPANSLDSNADTTWRCNNSPTGKISTYAPDRSWYAQKNYCDLVGLWVDPDTGDWLGLVHNEFTPKPYADGLHFDSIDYAVSHDQGKTWSIVDHAITSPYPTIRNDSSFPESTYYYGDGDPRLTVDIAAGYFYVTYGSRVVNKKGSWVAFHAHTARAPLSGKMARGTWQKYYRGAWSEPGVGGKESNIVPISDDANGYTAIDYDPKTPGTAAQQVAAGLTPPTSPLFVMDVTWNAYLGLWIGEPQAVDQSGKAPQQFYACSDLSKQKWTLLGDTGSYTTASWYRWLLDPATLTSSSIVGKDFRAYCSFGCSGGKSAEYVNLAIDTSSPAAPVDTKKTYRIKSSNGMITGTRGNTWTFKATGDGAYSIIDGAGNALGVGSTTADRAWGAKVSIAATTNTPSQQWWVIPNGDGTVRLVNRFSGLVLAKHKGSLETAPMRSWDAPRGGLADGRTADEQRITLTAL